MRSYILLSVVCLQLGRTFGEPAGVGVYSYQDSAGNRYGGTYDIDDAQFFGKNKQGQGPSGFDTGHGGWGNFAPFVPNFGPHDDFFPEYFSNLENLLQDIIAEQEFDEPLQPLQLLQEVTSLLPAPFQHLLTLRPSRRLLIFPSSKPLQSLLPPFQPPPALGPFRRFSLFPPLQPLRSIFPPYEPLPTLGTFRRLVPFPPFQPLPTLEPFPFPPLKPLPSLFSPPTPFANPNFDDTSSIIAQKFDDEPMPPLQPLQELPSLFPPLQPLLPSRKFLRFPTLKPFPSLFPPLTPLSFRSGEEPSRAFDKNFENQRLAFNAAKKAFDLTSNQAGYIPHSPGRFGFGDFPYMPMSGQNSAFSLGAAGPGFTHQVAAISPENPAMENVNVMNRFADAAKSGNGGYYSVSSSSYASSSDVNGQKQDRRGAETVVNNNGEVTRYKVEN